MAEAGTSHPHDSAHLHVTGAARYIDDESEPADLLHLAFSLSAQAHARIPGMDLSAVRAAPGVVAVLTAADIPGVNDISPIAHDDRVLADGEVIWLGQPLFLVAATSRHAARAAARMGRVDYEPLPALLTIAEAQAAESFIEPTQRMARGDAEVALAAAPHRLSGRFALGGQDHFYLEGQIALARPGEDGQVHILSSTQHPSEVQHLVAHVLDRPSSDVTVEVRRMGGGFGGKETQPALFAAAAALVTVVEPTAIEVAVPHDWLPTLPEETNKQSPLVPPETAVVPMVMVVAGEPITEITPPLMAMLVPSGSTQPSRLVVAVEQMMAAGEPEIVHLRSRSAMPTRSTASIGCSSSPSTSTTPSPTIGK